MTPHPPPCLVTKCRGLRGPTRRDPERRGASCRVRYRAARRGWGFRDGLGGGGWRRQARPESALLAAAGPRRVSYLDARHRLRRRPIAPSGRPVRAAPQMSPHCARAKGLQGGRPPSNPASKDITRLPLQARGSAAGGKGKSPRRAAPRGLFLLPGPALSSPYNGSGVIALGRPLQRSTIRQARLLPANIGTEPSISSGTVHASSTRVMLPVAGVRP